MIKSRNTCGHKRTFLSFSQVRNINIYIFSYSITKTCVLANKWDDLAYNKRKCVNGVEQKVSYNNLYSLSYINDTKKAGCLGFIFLQVVLKDLF